MQIEGKILPTNVVSQYVKDKIKHIEKEEKRQIKTKEKSRIKDDVIQELLPKAFSKLTKVYAYVDTHQEIIIINSIYSAKIDLFLTLLKRTFKSVSVDLLELNNPTKTLNHWLTYDSYPKSIELAEFCLLEDPNKRSRLVRCTNQPLTTTGIQAFLSDGYEVKQIGLIWNEYFNFVISNHFCFTSVKIEQLLDQTMESSENESTVQRWHTDFILFASTVTKMMNELLEIFTKVKPNSKSTADQHRT